MFSLTEEPRRIFLEELAKIPIHYDLMRPGMVMLSADCDCEARLAHARRLQADLAALMLEIMVKVFGLVRRYIMFELEPPVFNMEHYLASQPASSHEFYR